MKKTMSLLSLLFVAACGHMPSSETNSVENETAIFVSNAPIGSIVYIDGNPIGKATTEGKKKTTKENVYSIKAGTHQIKILSFGHEVFDQQVFVGQNITFKIIINE